MEIKTLKDYLEFTSYEECYFTGYPYDIECMVYKDSSDDDHKKVLELIGSAEVKGYGKNWVMCDLGKFINNNPKPFEIFVDVFDDGEDDGEDAEYHSVWYIINLLNGEVGEKGYKRFYEEMGA